MGPVLCLQRDPRTLEVALEEGKELACPERPVVWVDRRDSGVVVARESAAGNYEVHHFEICSSLDNRELGWEAL